MGSIELFLDEDLLRTVHAYTRPQSLSLNDLITNLLVKTFSVKDSRWLADIFLLMDKANVSSDGDGYERN